MKVCGIPYRSIWREEDRLVIIDQTRLPFEFKTPPLTDVESAAHAIRSMQVRGAPLIGATAAFGIALAMSADASDASLKDAATLLAGTRPTAVNLRWAIDRMLSHIEPLASGKRAGAAWDRAQAIADEDIALNTAIGGYGLDLLKRIAEKKGHVNVLTHCNAGWLATVDVGTALAPIYVAHDAGIPVHVWVDETRPRNQGLLTSWELTQHGVPNTLIVDNAGGHLMQRGEVDIVIVGADRVSAQGDVCNKIGTYLKALAANDCGVPFYAAVPTPTLDWDIVDALKEIPIEERSAAEVLSMRGIDNGQLVPGFAIAPAGTRAANPAFDVTPARLVTGLITDRGIAPATHSGMRELFQRKVA